MRVLSYHNRIPPDFIVRPRDASGSLKAVGAPCDSSYAPLLPPRHWQPSAWPLEALRLRHQHHHLATMVLGSPFELEAHPGASCSSTCRVYKIDDGPLPIDKLAHNRLSFPGPLRVGVSFLQIAKKQQTGSNATSAKALTRDRRVLRLYYFVLCTRPLRRDVIKSN